MIKIIGIGGCGNNILKFIKKQNFQIKKSNFEFISLNNGEDLENITFCSDDTIFTIAGFGGSKGGKFTLLLNQKYLQENIKIKNIIILPFNMERNREQANKDLEELISINQNTEVYPNDDIEDKLLSTEDSMRLYDEKIFDRIKRENQITWKNIIIEKSVGNKIYKALITYWSKDYKITLTEPEFKVLGSSHMLYMAPSKFTLKNRDTSIDNIIDIERIGKNILEEYIKSLS